MTRTATFAAALAAVLVLAGPAAADIGVYPGNIDGPVDQGQCYFQAKTYAFGPGVIGGGGIKCNLPNANVDASCSGTLNGGYGLSGPWTLVGGQVTGGVEQCSAWGGDSDSAPFSYWRGELNATMTSTTGNDFYIGAATTWCYKGTNGLGQRYATCAVSGPTLQR